MRDAVKIVLLETRNGIVGNPYTIGTNLLIITDHDHLLGDVEEKEALDA